MATSVTKGLVVVIVVMVVVVVMMHCFQCNMSNTFPSQPPSSTGNVLSLLVGNTCRL